MQETQPTVREWIRAHIDQFPTRTATIDACVQALNCSLKHAANIYGEEIRCHALPGDDTSPDVTVSGAVGGFSLEGRNLLASKPTDVWKARFYALRRGMGYTLDHLADQWGNSVDIIRTKARRFGSLRYVEDNKAPGQYVACVVHPDTPKGR